VSSDLCLWHSPLIESLANFYVVWRVNNQEKGAVMWVISHNYSINLDNCCYYRETVPGKPGENGDGTVFKMNNGRMIIITCPYRTVRHQISERRNFMTSGQIDEVCLEY
tara:strand:+ start:20 stop:346 length:327 start_codon:yes stop_codon:yes gene_type:complete